MSEKEKKPKSKLRKTIEWIGTIIVGIVFLFVAVCNISTALSKNSYGYGNSFGYSSYVVLTDSMEPVYKVDTAIITYKEEPAKILEEWNKISSLNLESTDERNINLTFFDAYNEEVDTGIPELCDQTVPTKAVMTHQLFKIIVNDDVEEGKGKYIFLVHGINISEHQSQQGQYQAFTEKELLGVVKLNSSFVGGVSKFFSSVWGLFICLLIPCLYLVFSSVIDIFKAYNSDEEKAKETASANASGIENLSNDEYEKLKAQMIEEMLNGKGDKKK